LHARAFHAAHVNESVILDYIDGRAPGRAEIENHLDVCDECRQLVAELAQTSLAAAPWGDRTPTEPQVKRALPEPGTLLGGRFRIGRALGHGAMGMVYEAVDEALSVPVAIKIFWPNLSEDPRVLDSIRREANLGRRIHHPNVRRVFDVETSGGVTFLTMELIDGETLEARLARGPVSETEAIRMLEQVCDALTAAHAAGIVHRDLKPGNIAIDQNGRVIVMDFGLARDVNAQASRHQGRGLVGTPAYWSPEQARGEPATAVSDVYSLGLIAYRLLSGESFSLGGENALSKRYAGVVNRCLEQRPQRRFPSASAVRKALQSANRGSSAVLLACVGFAAAAVILAASAATLLRSPPPVAAVEAPRSDVPALRPDPEAATKMAVAAPTATTTSNPGAEVPSLPIEALPSTPTQPAGRPRVRSAPREPRPTTAPAANPPASPGGASTAAAPASANDSSRRPERPRRPIDREDPYSPAP
jgi:serine/threonine-protein kinase